MRPRSLPISERLSPFEVFSFVASLLFSSIVANTMWRVTPGQTLRHRGWGDEFVLYNSISGDTHLLGASAMRVLTMLQRADAEENHLIASLCDESQTEIDEEAAHEVGKILSDLTALSLIEPVEPN